MFEQPKNRRGTSDLLKRFEKKRRNSVPSQNHIIQYYNISTFYILYILFLMQGSLIFDPLSV